MRVEGVECGLCAARAENAISRLPGVKTVTVDFDSQKIRVKLEKDSFIPSIILQVQDSIDDVVFAKPVRRILDKMRNIILRERITVDNHHS